MKYLNDVSYKDSMEYNMSIKMKLKHLITISLAVLLSACNQPPPMQSNAYQEHVPAHTPIQQDNDGIDASDVALGVATGAVVGAVAKSSYDKRKAKQRQVVVVNKYYNSKPVQGYTKKHNSKRK